MRHGTRNGTGLLGLLRELRSESFTGTLNIRDPSLHVRVHLVAGEVVFVQTAEPRHSFPAALIRNGSISKEKLRSALAEAEKSQDGLNQILVNSGAMSTSELEAELTTHCLSLLGKCFAFNPAEWAARNQTPPKSPLGNLPLSAESAFFHAMIHTEPARHREAMDPVQDLPLRTTPLFKTHGKELMKALQVAGGDPIIASLARPGVRLATLLKKHDPDALMLRAHMLVSAGMLAAEEDGSALWVEIAGELGLSAVEALWAEASAKTQPAPQQEEGKKDKKKTPTTAAPAVTAASLSEGDPFNIPVPIETPEAPSDPPKEPAAELPTPGQYGTGVEGTLIETAFRIQSQDFYTCLDVEPDAPFSDILEAGRVLLARYSEEAYAGTMLAADAQKALRFIERRVKKAQEVLLSEEARTAYHEHANIQHEMRVPIAALAESHQLRVEGATAMHEDRPLDGQGLYQRALDLVAHDAALHVDIAWSLFVGMWSDSSTPEDTRESTRATITEHMEEALSLRPKQLHVLRLAGRMARMEGRDAEAMGFFQRVLGVDAQDSEARDAVRDYRKQGVTTADTEGGGAAQTAEEMLGKLSGFFKKKG